MKHLYLRRFVPALLCLALLLSLSACGKQDEESKKDGAEEAAASLARLRGDLACSDALAGAVAYLGRREQRDRSPMADWLSEHCGGLAAELPFLPDIPDERILGAGFGDLYCIVPRDEQTSLAVNHITWQQRGNGLHPEADEVLYREECAQPVLVFVGPGEPDIEITLVTNEGVVLSWTPQIDEYEVPILPTDDDGMPLLMDFAIYGYTTGLDYGGDWDGGNWDDGEPAGDDWWLPPTDMGLADTTWVCDDWLMNLHYGDCDPDYAGIAELYHRFEDNTELTRVFSGVWRMEDDCLRLDLSAGVGSSLSGSFPILISPSGEEMHFQRSRSGEGVPFLPDDMDSIDLARSYG